MSQPLFEPPTFCIAGGHSTKELLQQLFGTSRVLVLDCANVVSNVLGPEMFFSGPGLQFWIRIRPFLAPGLTVTIVLDLDPDS
jgi:hypothetical protein